MGRALQDDDSGDPEDHGRNAVEGREAFLEAVHVAMLVRRSMRLATSAAARPHPPAVDNGRARTRSGHEEAADEHRRAVRRVRRAFLSREDAAAAGVVGAGLDERRVGDVPEAATRASDRHPGERHCQYRRQAGEQEAEARDART